MGIYYKSALRIWFVLTLPSFAVDGACYWLAQNSPAPMPGAGSINYIAIFLVSATLPYGLAIAIVVVGVVLALAYGVVLVLRRALRPAKARRDYTAAPPMRLASGHKS